MSASDIGPASAYNNAPMNYFVRTESGAEHGPLSARQLRDAARSGALSRGDLVRPEGTVDWFRADKVRGLEFADFAAETVSPAQPSVQATTPPGAATPPGAPAPTPSPASAATPPLEPPPQVRRDDGLIRHIEPLAARGFNVRKLEGEEVESVTTQSFLDVLRLSIPAALLGRRGLLVVTNRRVFVANATVSTRALQSAYLDRIDRIGFGGRVAIARLVMGAMLALGGVAAAVGPMLLALVTGAGLAPPALGSAALPFIVVGILLVLLARYRALEIGVASGTLVFAKRALELDALSRIDELRDARLAHLSSGASASAHIS